MERDGLLISDLICRRESSIFAHQPTGDRSNECDETFGPRAASACCLVLLLFASAAAQQQASQPPLPSAPDWALIAGWDVYAKKGCG
jgi:hypothetical protein